MKILLDEVYFIEDTGGSYTFSKFTGEQKEVFNKELGINEMLDETSVICYPPTLESCLQKYARLKIVDSYNKIKLQDYVNQFNQNYREIKEKLNLIGITR